MVGDQITVDGSQAGVENKKSDELIWRKLHINGLFEEENIKQVAAYGDKVTPIAADVIVETFPLRPINRSSANWDG